MTLESKYPFATRLDVSGMPDATPTVLVSDDDTGLDNAEMADARAAIAARNHVVIFARTETGLATAIRQFKNAERSSGAPIIN